MMDYIYMLRCGDGSFYTGWTNHLHSRLKAHAEGRGAKYTKSHQPVKLVRAESLPDKSAAMKREAAVKALTRQEKEQLVSAGQAAGQKVFYLMGKSASGKDSLYAGLLDMPELSLRPLVIYTTRPIRDGEEEGRQYHFTDEEHFHEWEKQGKVIEQRCYQTVYGPWYYFTLDDGSFDPGVSAAGETSCIEGDEPGRERCRPAHILGIGTLESYLKLRDYLGADRVVPLYVEVEDGLRLQRAIKREQQQLQPKYEEMCRRFLADAEDFSEEHLAQAGIERRFSNAGRMESCLEELADAILLEQYQ